MPASLLVVLQTPGATASVVDGGLVVILRDVPDGPVRTVAETSEPVEVVTSVRQADQPAVVTREVASGGPIAVEVRGIGRAVPVVRALSETGGAPVPSARVTAPATPEVGGGYVPRLSLPGVPVPTLAPTLAPTAAPALPGL